MIRILSLLIIIVSVSDGYKIRRSECVMSEEDESTMLCTCGGIGDPYSIIMNKVSIKVSFIVTDDCSRVPSQSWECHGTAPGMVTTSLSR